MISRRRPSERDAARHPRTRALDPPGHDPPRQDPYPYRAPPSAEPLAALLVQLGAAADLEPARSPGIHPLEIVDDEGDARVGHQIAPLLRASHITRAADLDHVILGPRRNPTGTTCGEPSRPTVAKRPSSCPRRYSISFSVNVLVQTSLRIQRMSRSPRNFEVAAP
jgi:hypothetical protein